MLILCPECELQVSDKAISCPHCGFPLKKNIKSKTTKTKRRRLPNGFGQISEIKNRNLRKRFRAMITVGFNESGRPICAPLRPTAYFETYNEAYNALVDYHKNPYDLDPGIKMKDLYDLWSAQYYPKLKSESSIRTLENAWRYCSEIYSMKVAEIRPRHLKGCIENGTAKTYHKKIEKATPGIKSRIKSLFNLMFDYALEYELVNVNYARTFELSKDIIIECEKRKKGHIPYTSEEMDMLWASINTIDYVDLLVFQCYSGWRPSELGLLELSDVDFENNRIKGGIKTPAGENRYVPIHSKVRFIVEQRYEQAKALGSKYLFNVTDAKTHKDDIRLTYDKFKTRYAKIVRILNLNPEHRPHDGRKHFVTAAKKADMNEFAIKYIVGHEIEDITEKIYTVREPSWYASEIEKIK